MRMFFWKSNWDYLGIGHGSRSGTGLIGRDFGAITPQTKLADQSIIQGMFLLSCLWVKLLFDYVAYACDYVC